MNFHSLFILKHSSSEQTEIVHTKLFNADLNCLVLLDKFLLWEWRLLKMLMPK
jgi:hypothetical protein